ncbi:MAG: GGDEF domain-containing protein [Flexistipes sinusarabici]|uniref:diguanylate cyclase n=1 Tax=Flexistipes sinusarabici TaxID=2352 RepID=A0A5D0MRX9_FLESI|nr:GGDEF domain-containing protein [Flexistipes sinusarabici]TYB34703.1 MAG: GGDEF domain-containing protein [Flexistipes sinusarabici]
MGKVNNILKENGELKSELEGILGLVKENEAKYEGFKVVEYAFLMSESLEDYSEKPLKYLEEIFSIDRALLFVNNEVFEEEVFGEIDYLDNIIFTEEKTFRYFYLEKRPYCDSGKTNMIKEFDLKNDDFGSYLFSPVIENNKIIASLNLYSKDPSRFDGESSFDFIRDLSFKISVSLRKIYDSLKLYRQSRVDMVSKTYNTLAMYEFLNQALHRYFRYDCPFDFYLFEIDDLKKIVDEYGHRAGDKFIRNLGSLMYENFRKSDVIGRFGRDVFYLIMTHSDGSAYDDIAHKFKQILQNVCKENGFDTDLGVVTGHTDASGISSFTENEKLCSEDILNIVDELLSKNR